MVMLNLPITHEGNRIDALRLVDLCGLINLWVKQHIHSSDSGGILHPRLNGGLRIPYNRLKEVSQWSLTTLCLLGGLDP